MKITSAFVAVLLLAGMCAAQSDTPAADQDSNQNVAAAARANRAKEVRASVETAPSSTATMNPVKIDPAKEADIRRLLAMTGAAGLGTQAMDEMEKSMRPLMTNSLPPGDYRDQLVELFFQRFHEKHSPDHLVDLMVPIYDKYYSDDEIKGLIQLYQTDLGKKMLSVLPKIMAESQAAGGRWGQELGRECMIEVLAEHPDLRKQLEAASAKNGQQ